MKCIKSVANESTDVANESTDVANESKNVANESKNVANESTGVANESTGQKCKFCNKKFGRSIELNKHEKSACKEKNDHVRRLEIMLNIDYPLGIKHTECRFCKKVYSEKCGLTKHLKKCQIKDDYRDSLELKLKDSQKQNQQITNNHTINNINVLNVSAETLRKFGEESTDHITNEYLRKIIGRLGVPLPKVVSTVAKQIYCDSSKPDNQTLQITNVRSQWAKVSNGNRYELQPLGQSVSGIRNKVTDLYVERQCDEPDYFKKVNARIEKLDDLNNQNYIASTIAEKEDQKIASKLKSEIDREIKSTIYNTQKTKLISS
jgi:hypothetical protein